MTVMTKVVISRPVNGISLNGKEYVLDDKGDIKLFDTRDTALDFLKANGVTENDMDSTFMQIEEYEGD